MKHLHLLIFLFLFIVQAFAQPNDWQWQNPLPTGSHLHAVYFADSLTGWSVGSEGTIIKTTDGGVDWFTQKSGTTASLLSVYFHDAQTGWVVGAGQNVLKTTNGGDSWIKQPLGQTSFLTSVSFSDSQNGWAVGGQNTILKTSNGGATWINQTSGMSITSFLSVYALNPQTCWLVGGGGIILKTINGGISWIEQPTGTLKFLNHVQFLDSLTGWAVGEEGTILKTTNGGSNWINQSSGTQRLTEVHFVDSLTGWVVGGKATLLKTTNGGNTWSPYLHPGLDGKVFWLNAVHFANSQNGWVVGEGGAILKTTNGGSTWNLPGMEMFDLLSSVDFIDSQTGWAVGGTFYSSSVILKTNDGGFSWIKQVSETTHSLQSVDFIDSQTGWAVGRLGTILKTSDGGNHWTLQVSGTQNDLFSVEFVNAQVGWAVGYAGIMLGTVDGGITWTIRESPTFTYQLNDIQFMDDQTGWAVGNGGTILVTTNGGIDWGSLSSGTSHNLYAVSFIDSQTGWAVGGMPNWSSNGSIILKTTNGGLTWVPQTISTITYPHLSVVFLDALTGWIGGGYGNILKTTDGGNSWVKQSGTTYATDIKSICFVDGQKGWAVGAKGAILTTLQNQENMELTTTLVEGYLFEKGNADCSPTAVAVPRTLVKATPGPYYGISNLAGNFRLRLPLADTLQTFALKPIPNSIAFQSTILCPPSGQIAVTVDSLPDTLSGNNFGIDITPCHHLNVHLSSNRRRRCFQNMTSILYGNMGSLEVTDAYILVEFPHWVQAISASRPHVALSDSVWRFNLGTVSAGGYGSITITDSVLCDSLEIIGLSQCTKATIYPAPDCPPNNWSGAEVSVSGKCENGLVKLGIYNRTSVAMPDSVDYFVFLDSVQVKVGKVKLAAGDSLKLSVQPNGMGVYLSVNQVANHPGQVFVTTTVEGCGVGTMSLSTSVSTHLPVAQLPNSKTQCLPIIGAYDPNDKQVFPIGFTNQNMVAPGTRLEYLVRFQNTGNDTAFTVYVIDTLDQNLNMESFEMGAASHPFELSMQTVKSGKTLLRWQFNNILLPDSNTNEPASNGFIQFRISPKPGLALGSKVRNHAEIYFDFNPPIITNQTLSTFDLITFRDSTLNDNVQVVTSADKLLERELGVKLYPNPVTHNQLTAAFAEAGSLTLYDARGSVLYHKTRIEGVEVLPVSLKPGFYFATVETGKGRKSVKVVVE